MTRASTDTSIPSPTTAVYKALLRADGRTVAALAAIPDGAARFFVVQRGEEPEAFIGRVSTWVKAQGAAGLQMAEPDVLSDGIEVGQVLMRIRHALGVPRNIDAPEFDVANVDLQWSEQIKKSSS